MLPRSYLRLAWIACTNAGFIYLLASGGAASTNLWTAGLLTAGLLLEIICSRAAAVLNVGAWLIVPFTWIWERAHDTSFRSHPGEYSLTLIAFVLPAIMIAVVNLCFYVPALLKSRRARA